MINTFCSGYPCSVTLKCTLRVIVTEKYTSLSLVSSYTSVSLSQSRTLALAFSLSHLAVASRFCAKFVRVA